MVERQDASVLQTVSNHPLTINEPTATILPFPVVEQSTSNAAESDTISPRLTDAEVLCNHMTLLRRNKGLARRPISEADMKAATKLLTVDGTTLDVATAALDWALSTNYWSTITLAKFCLDAIGTILDQMAGANVKLPVTRESIERWIDQCIEDATAKEIEDRAGVYFTQPDPPDGLDRTQVRKFMGDSRREWIRMHRPQIAERVWARESAGRTSGTLSTTDIRVQEARDLKRPNDPAWNHDPAKSPAITPLAARLAQRQQGAIAS